MKIKMLSLEKKLLFFLLICIVCNTNVSADTTDCKSQILDVFHEHILPLQYFHEALYYYNEAYLQTTNNVALEYFRHLLLPINNITLNKASPNDYCENSRNEREKKYCHDALYIMLGDKERNYQEEVDRILAMNGTEAFKHVYLTLTYPKLEEKLDEWISNNVHPEPGNDQVDSNSTNLLKSGILNKMKGYYYRCINEDIDNLEFLTIEQFCEIMESYKIGDIHLF